MPDNRFSGQFLSADEDGLASAFDDLPVWSAPFGLKLLDTVVLKPNIVALDIGCGAGFPVVELAERLGPSATVHGVDTWGAALARVQTKLRVRGVSNVVLHEACAEKLPLPDQSADLVVSNNGLNNVGDLEAAVAGCARVCRPGAQLVYTYNLPETMREFYEVYDSILGEMGLEHARQTLAAHIFAKRKPIAFTLEIFERSGFRIERIIEDSFSLRFADATAMFAHSFMRLGFLPPWLEVLDPSKREPVFTEIETRLNAMASAAGGLALTVPFACLDFRRVSKL